MKQSQRDWGGMACGWLLMLASAIAWAQAVSGPSVAPAELVRQTVANELKSSNDEQDYMFQSRKQTPNGSQTRLYVQTKDAMAGLTVAFNDKALTAEQRAAEDARNQRLIDDSDALKHKQKQEKEDSDRVNRIVKALPDAFLYERAGTTVGTAGVGKPGDELVQLKFRPNPDYSPPSRIEQVLAGMQGVVLIDANQLRIAQIDGTLFKDVGFGWGILGHLDHGGHFLVEQGSVGENGWATTHMSLSFTGKILLFKSNIKSEEVFSGFRAVPANLTFAQGVELLKRQEAVLAEKIKPGRPQIDPK